MYSYKQIISDELFKKISFKFYENHPMYKIIPNIDFYIDITNRMFIIRSDKINLLYIDDNSKKEYINFYNLICNWSKTDIIEMLHNSISTVKDEEYHWLTYFMITKSNIIKKIKLLEKSKHENQELLSKAYKLLSFINVMNPIYNEEQFNMKITTMILNLKLPDDWIKEVVPVSLKLIYENIADIIIDYLIPVLKEHRI